VDQNECAVCVLKKNIREVCPNKHHREITVLKLNKKIINTANFSQYYYRHQYK